MESFVADNPAIILWVLGGAGSLILSLMGALFFVAKSTISDLKQAIKDLNSTLTVIANDFTARDHRMDKRIGRVEQFCQLNHDVVYPELEA